MSYVIIVVKRLRIYIGNRESLVLGGYLYLLRSTNISDNPGVGAVGGNLVYYTCGITDRHAANCTYSVLIQSVLGVIYLSVTIFALSPMVGSVGCVGGGIGVIYHGSLVVYDSLATLRAGLSSISYRVAGGGRDNYSVLVIILRAVLPLYRITTRAGTEVERILAVIEVITIVLPLAVVVSMIGYLRHVSAVNVGLLTLIAVVVIVSVSVLAYGIDIIDSLILGLNAVDYPVAVLADLYGRILCISSVFAVSTVNAILAVLAGIALVTLFTGCAVCALNISKCGPSFATVV